jgi:hypothetical protein
MRDAVLSHHPLLVRHNAKLAPRLRRAQEHESSGFIFREKRVCPRLVHPAANQPPRASQTSALMADRRQTNAVPRGRIPDEFVALAPDAVFALRRLEHNQVTLALIHAAASFLLLLSRLRVIEPVVLAVWRLARFAAPEVARRNAFAIALVRQQLDKPRLVLYLFIQDA